MAENQTICAISSARPRSLPWALLSYLVLTPLMALGTICFGTLSMIASLFDTHGRVQHRLARAWATTMLRFALCPTEVVGPGAFHLGIPPITPAVYAANHLSYMDTPLIFSKLPFQFRIVARSGLWTIPFIGWYLHRSGQIPVDATSLRSSLAGMNGGAKALAAGTPLMIFPEGGRSPDGTLQPFMKGPAYMAVKAGVPIVPMTVIGTYRLLPIHTSYLQPRRLRLAIGAPIDTAGYTTRNLDPLTAAVRAAIQDLQQQYGGASQTPAPSPVDREGRPQYAE